MLRCCTGMLLLVFALGLQSVIADDAPLAWDVLLKEKDTLIARMAQLQKTYQTAATAEDKVKLRDEFVAATTQMEQKILPQLEAQFPAQLEKSADEATLKVASELIQINFQRNRFPMVNKLTALVLAKEPKHALAANFSAVAKFATHDFEGAVKAFEEAKAQGTYNAQMASQFELPAKSYIDYWMVEQDLRAKEDAAQGEQQLPRVKFQTSSGDIVLELFEDQAPNTVANFISLVEAKFYDGLRFHRVIPGFMAQGGCPFTRAGQDARRAGQGGPGYQINCECYEPAARRHFAGTISMAHAGKDSGGSQFFITHLPTPHLDRDLNPEGAHTVFGRVVEGMNVVYDLGTTDTITAATVVRKRNHEYKPKTSADAPPAAAPQN